MSKQSPTALPAYTAEVKANKNRCNSSDTSREVRELVLEIDAPDFSCEAGQSIGVYAPEPPHGQPNHLRWYSIADAPARDDRRRLNLTICVRRMVWPDPDSGQTTYGVASNYLCDLKPGETLRVTGPRGTPFVIPPTNDSTVICIGTGTGIAPFRHFIKALARKHPDWKGVVRLFYGAQNGLDILYANDPNSDWEQYFDQETFDIIERMSPPPNWADPIGWDLAFSERGDELIRLLEQPNTYVYVAGLREIGQRLDQLFSKLMGSANAWNLQKQELITAGQWTELLY